MKEEMLGALDRASEFLKALSGRSRLMILCHLWDGEKSVGELVRLTGARDTAVSQQLALLRKDGIVAARRDGQTLYYSIADEGAARVLETLHAVFCPADAAKPSPPVVDARGG
ncbi:ArsR/SmtB family transcription factor [Sphingomonas canadensis]|uniref:ArsR/SmtB family transcription factor n=1 Tax=Sphingomonas canadensis TaxID=1219257 RepID=A0ABW3H881_9SPHN|nr:metalloregulator ArsR/SmtB family transcription factor [Sphingomonas canadensis]MCW3837434.1 metalloregulator ArsR/SmtB family transcription factor [Sphingomonas canadensis]